MTAQFTSQWISPLQAMPPIDNNTSIMVMVYDETVGLDLAYYDYTKQSWLSCRGSASVPALKNVIAWCPLPPTPIINDEVRNEVD